MQTGTQKAQLGVVGNVSYQFTPNHRISLENFYTHSGRDEGRSFEGDQPRQRPRLPELPPAVHRRRADVATPSAASTSSRACRTAASTGASTSRAPPATSRTCARRSTSGCSTQAGTSETVNPFTYADESQSGFRMFNDARRRHDRRRRQLERSSSTAGGRPTQYKFGVNYVDRTRDFQSRRFHFIPITTQKADTGNLLFDNRAHARSSSSPRATSARRSASTRRRGRPTPTTGDQTTTSGYGMVDIALTGAHAADRRRPRRAVRPDRQHAGSVRPVRPRGAGRRTRTRTSSRPSTSCRASAPNSNLRLSYSTTVNRPEFRELAEFEFTDVVGNRAVKGNPT